MAPTSNSHLELNVNAGMALQGSPVIVLMLIPPTITRVTINSCLSAEDLRAVATTSSASTETMLSQNGDLECVSKDGLVIYGASPPPGRGTKRLRDATGDHPEEGPSKHPRTEAGPSTPSAINVVTTCFKKGEGRRVSGEIILSN
ncbi:hypothetical protein BJY52DRAFT_1187726 [Lactarius psammicola]|nr:hypothetical protein BJY52DRAFT_1187726 [Lactarius psammicola]